MKKFDVLKKLAIGLCAVLPFVGFADESKADTDYVVMASSTVQKDADWNKVALKLQKQHNAGLIYFEKHPEDCEAQLKTAAPRYVAIVEKPENINDSYVMRIAKLSRRMDSDIYADWLWGIITGYDAESAGKMVENSATPMVVRNCVSDIMELESAKWFDNYAWVDDHKKGKAGKKKGFDSAVETYEFNFDDELNIFSSMIYDYDPDLIVTASHATFNDLTVPFMPPQKGHFVSDAGVIWKEVALKKTEPLRFTGKRNIFFPVGNCLIAGINNDPNSMPPAWIKSGNTTALIGYVVTTWYGRNGWGGLKYWLTTSGRYTLPEAMFLNQQDMMAQMNRWDTNFHKIDYPFTKAEGETGSQFELAAKRLDKGTGIAFKDVNIHMIGFLHDRDVVAYYGDPMWNVRLQPVPKENDITITQEKKGKNWVVTVTTKENFSLERLKGDHFKEEHVLDLPFSVFFDKRLKNPKPAAGQKWDAVMDENFLLIYNPEFKPSEKYEIVIESE